MGDNDKENGVVSSKIAHYVDPMSYNNLSIYDHSLLSNIKDFDVHYFCNVKYDLGDFNVIFHKIYEYTDKNKFNKLISYFKSQLKVFRALKNSDVAIVHFQWFKVPLVDYLLLKRIKKRASSVKIVFTAHNLLPHGTGDRFLNIFKKIYSLVDAIIVHSAKTKSELIEELDIRPEKIHVIPHGILNIGEKITAEKVEELMEGFKRDFKLDNTLIFSALGTISDYKGIDLIVDAWKQDNICKNMRLKLIIAGKGHHVKLEELNNIENVCVINKFLQDEEFFALLKLSDYILLPYRQISQSGVLLTAINEKKRVIVSDKGGLADPFQIGSIGYVLKELSSKELNRLIIKASIEKNNYPDSETWNRIFEYYDWSNIGEKTKNLYEVLSK